ncbi:hypothetical protein GGR54DRAFT_633120 [Hypoxylon sp. NC1633]|nr:hypothetical protein GGR54DRAFT_633120 [Hypoxylon sp. NC1633]
MLPPLNCALLLFCSLFSRAIHPFQEDLNYHEAILGSRQSSINTATIPSQDTSVFTTESQQSSWLPSSSSSLPAQSAQPNIPPLQQDFILFDQPSPQPHRQNVNRTVSSPASSAAPTFGSRNVHRNHSSAIAAATSPSAPNSASPSFQNQRVAQIIRSTGHPISSSSSAFTNRFHLPAQNQNLQQFYAPLSASPATAVANQQNRPARPPVPLFSQNSSGQQNAPVKMDFQDALNFEDFTPFEGGGATAAFSSPGVPGYDVNVSSGSSSASNIGTVSPQDLLLSDHFTSAPNSAAITNLTSPSMYGESPDLHDNYETSPNFESADFDNGSKDTWFSLFPEQDNATENVSAADQSPAEQSEDLEDADIKPLPRRKSADSPSGAASGRHSSVSGVNARRRDKPLPPIVVNDPSDTVAMKRARNTLAARKSRERKAIRFEELEAKIANLEKERDYWKNKALSLSQSG